MRPPMRIKQAAAALLLAAASGCASTPPDDVENACRIFEDKPDWYEATRDTEKKWGTPIQLQLAIIRQESSFKHDAKPPHARFLGIPLWWRQSSAYGYAQIKDSTWDWYRDKTGNRWADRGELEDAVDFIGWYTDLSKRTLGISKWDGYNQYLAYHEGHAGFKRRTYKKKPWLMKVARRVDRYSRTYGAQLKRCRGQLEENRSWWPF
jgi:hypothetical protein